MATQQSALYEVYLPVLRLSQQSNETSHPRRDPLQFLGTRREERACFTVAARRQSNPVLLEVEGSLPPPRSCLVPARPSEIVSKVEGLSDFFENPAMKQPKNITLQLQRKKSGLACGICGSYRRIQKAAARCEPRIAKFLELCLA